MRIFGIPVTIDFRPPEQEAINAHCWSRLVELGLASEAVEECIEEYPDDQEYKDMLPEVAAAEVAYASRPWWQKL